MINSPLLFNLVLNLFSNKPFSPSENLAEATMLNLNSTLVFTLFTFCPPGPELREAENWHSSSKFRLFNLSGFISSCCKCGTGLFSRLFLSLLLFFLLLNFPQYNPTSVRWNGRPRRWSVPNTGTRQRRPTRRFSRSTATWCVTSAATRSTVPWLSRFTRWRICSISGRSRRMSTARPRSKGWNRLVSTMRRDITWATLFSWTKSAALRRIVPCRKFRSTDPHTKCYAFSMGIS